MAREGTTESVAIASPYEPHPVLRWLYRRFFSHIVVDDRWSGVVRSASERGVVIYVLRSISFLDFLCLDFLVKRFGLPVVRFVNDLGLWILEPFGKGDRRLRFKRQIPEQRALTQTVRAKHSALLFLRRPPNFGSARGRGQRLEVDLLTTLVEAQRTMDVPILLVPQTFVWSKLPPHRRRSIRDWVFGPSEWPGRLRVFFQFLLNYRNALLRSGEPFDLAAFVRENPDLTDAQIADRIRFALLRRMERERTLVLGPVEKSPDRMIDEIVRGGRMRAQLAAIQRKSKTPAPKLEREARTMLRRLAARPSVSMLLFLKSWLDRVWNRIYDGMVVDQEGIERLRAAAREGNLVLLPSHKSHVDYLVLSDVLYSHALSPPLVAAGDNLSFWPLGWVLRHAGAFFIRRSFRGNKLYSAIVDAYVRKMMVEGYSLEFFIEGGRSRTGKLLPPKLGLLSMVVDAAIALRNRKTFFVPISIGYERIIEQRSYVEELGGGEKQAENLGGLLKAPRVLQSRYGRLYVQFGEMMSLDSMLPESALMQAAAANRGDTPSGGVLTPSARRALVQRIAHRVTYEINRVTVVTPASLVATALLVHRRRGMAHWKLVETATSTLDALRSFGARLAEAVATPDGALRGDALDAAVQLFAAGRLVTVHGDPREAIYSVPEERRIALEYYQNNILHFFVPSALISSVIAAYGPESVPLYALRDRVQMLSRLFKYEFMYRADTSFEQIFDDALTHMLDCGELDRIGDELRAGDGRPGARVALYASLLRTYFEAHQVALRGLEPLLSGALPRKEWLRRSLAAGQRMYLSGEIELRESLSRPKLENAVAVLRDLDLVKYGEQDVLERGATLTSLEDLRNRAQELARYLA